MPPFLPPLIENCRSNGLDPRAYLRDTITALHRRVTDYDALTPRIYATTNQRRCGFHDDQRASS